MARFRPAQSFLPGLAPPRQPQRERLETPEFEAEAVIERIVGCISVLRPGRKFDAPIDRRISTTASPTAAAP
jgi:hypothetical protein